MSRYQKLLATLNSRRPGESARTWVGRILDSLPPEAEVDDDMLTTVMRTVNGSLGDEQRHIEEDPGAYVDFWRAMVERIPSRPLARAAYADTLLLTGDTEGARREMLAAMAADPMLLYQMSGEYRGLMERAGGREWATYRAIAIRAAELDDPELHREYVIDELRDLLAEVDDDPELRQAVMQLLRPRSV